MLFQFSRCNILLSTMKLRFWNREEAGSCLNGWNHVPDCMAGHSRRLNSVCILVTECLKVLCVLTD